MVDDGVFTTNAQIQARAGVYANSTAKATAATDVYVLDVEAYVNSKTKFNWSDAFAGLDVDVKALCTEASASLCANKVIVADMSGFTSRAEAQTMLDFNQFNADRAIKELSDKEVSKFMSGV